MWLLEVELIASTSSEDIADASVLRAHKTALWEAADVSSALEARPSAGCCSPLQVACPSGSQGAMAPDPKTSKCRCRYPLQG